MMIEITFEEFYEYKFIEEGFELYVMKNGLGDILYVGISNQSIWSRWFGFGGHMFWDGNVAYGNSPVGTKIEFHMPDSLYWKIQLWTLKDCVKFCKDDLSQNASVKTIGYIEPYMIQKLSPALNSSCNLNPGKDTTPKSEKEIEHEKLLDKIYRDVFENKTKRSSD